jgi:membrane protease YdiL (CAAX protease family)
VNRRSRTAPVHRKDDAARLALWLGLVGLLIVVGYAGRADGGKPSGQLLYHWSTGIGGLIQDAVILGLVLLVARPRWGLLALRRPPLARGAGLVAATVIGILVFEGLYEALTHPGNEQGLTASHWEPRHALAYVFNGLVICTWVPFVEELTYRGLGYSLLERFGRWPAIVAVGVLFALSHGLLVSLPVLIVFGGALAWIRSTTDSVVPGMVAHGTYNLVILVLTVVL